MFQLPILLLNVIVNMIFPFAPDVYFWWNVYRNSILLNFFFPEGLRFWCHGLKCSHLKFLWPDICIRSQQARHLSLAGYFDPDGEFRSGLKHKPRRFNAGGLKELETPLMEITDWTRTGHYSPSRRGLKSLLWNMVSAARSISPNGFQEQDGLPWRWKSSPLSSVLWWGVWIMSLPDSQLCAELGLPHFFL